MRGPIGPGERIQYSTVEMLDEITTGRRGFVLTVIRGGNARVARKILVNFAVFCIDF